MMAFYDVMFNQCQPALAMERYAGEVSIQHNPAVADVLCQKGWLWHVCGDTSRFSRLP